MNAKKFILFLIFFVICSHSAHTFNLTQELKDMNQITDTFELIAGYQKIAKQVRVADSTRLSKKLVRIIKGLDIICQDQEDEKIKKAYLVLLNTALANEKLKSIDHENELDEITKLYLPKEKKVKREANIKTKENEIDELSEIEIEKETEEIKEIEELIDREKIREELKLKISMALENNMISRSEIKKLLTLKKLTNHVDKLTNNIDTIDPAIQQIFRKLEYLEEIIKDETLEEHITRSLTSLLDTDERTE